MKKYSLQLLIPLFLFGCSGEPADDTDEIKRPEPPLKIVSPKNEAQYTVGDLLEIDLSIPDKSKISDIEIYIDDTLYQKGLAEDLESISVETDKGRVGYVKIFVAYKDEKGEKHGDTRNIVFFSDIVPKQLTAVNMKTHPHDKNSYTQGLEFYKGKLFEATGQMGQSMLAEVDLNTGAILRKIDLEKRYFGEGITILNDTIYQLTWSERTCFVYDMNFNLIKEYAYDGEGWGLCNDGTYLIMSNGSSEIIWRNRNTFEIIKRIQVFSDQSETDSLNELELIDGNLFINVYTEDRIIEVDTATGKILSEIDCSGIVKDGRVPGADVLNGIAYNPLTGKIYITGKWWPKLYEVKFEE